MLSKILSRKSCAECRFCCSFRRQSLWETPLFTQEMKLKLEKKFPQSRFKAAAGTMFTIDLDDAYKTSDPEEEAACPFLDVHKGCVLSAEEKPFDCSIWPFRACRKDGALKVMLENTCPALNDVPHEKIQEVIEKDGLGKKILEAAEKNPAILKDYDEDYMIVM